LNQVDANKFPTTFSVYYTLDMRAQSKIIFGEPQLNLYAKDGSTAKDIQWAQVANTTNFEDVQWISQVHDT